MLMVPKLTVRVLASINIRHKLIEGSVRSVTGGLIILMQELTKCQTEFTISMALLMERHYPSARILSRYIRRMISSAGKLSQFSYLL
jgi:hypothetical protein